MATNNMPWFRLYSEILDDKKIKRICRTTGHPKALVIGVWVCFLALANESGERGRLTISENIAYKIDDLADETGLEEADLTQIIDQFEKLEMIITGEEDQAIEIKNWNGRQFQSDSSNERVKKYRDRREKLGMTRSRTYDTKVISKRDGNKCVYCGSEHNLVVDHVTPIILGGTDDMDNLVCACKECNSGKAGRTPEMAGYKFIDPIAEQRYNGYLANTSNSYSKIGNGYSHALDTDTDTDTDTESNTISATVDFFDEILVTWETKTGIPILPGADFAIMVKTFEKVGVTAKIYGQALDEMLQQDSYPLKRPTSAQEWAINIRKKMDEIKTIKPRSPKRLKTPEEIRKAYQKSWGVQ